MENENFMVILKSKLPPNINIMPTVQQMKCKCNIATGNIKKHKVRLNIDSSKIKKRFHYEDIFTPIILQASVRLLTILATVLGWYTVQLDYVQAFPQAPTENPIYLKIPIGFQMSKGAPKDYILKVNKNMYSQR